MANEKQRFQPGDVVQVKSGGPAMTVARTRGENELYDVMCEWFDGKKPCHGTFTSSTLELYKPGGLYTSVADFGE